MFDHTIDNISQHFGKKRGKQNDKAYAQHEIPDPSYYFIANNVYHIDAHLRGLREYLSLKSNNEFRTERFLDCGCGPGNVIMQAKEFGAFPIHNTAPHYHGIELDKEAAKLGRILLGAPEDTHAEVRGGSHI